MYNIYTLTKQLTHEEYVTGRNIFIDMVDAGAGVLDAAAVCYRAGYLDAQRAARKKRRRYEDKAAQKSQPEANATADDAGQKEGSNTQ